MTNQERAPIERRKFNLLLAIGIFFLPIIFVWFLLRRGHSTTARIIGFGWTLLWLAVAITGNPSTSAPSQSPTVERQQNEMSDAERAAQEAERTRREVQRRLERSPEAFLTLENTNAVRGGFDTVFLLDGSIRNSAEVDIKDPTIACDLFASSGTRLGAVRQTLFEIIPAQGTKRFAELNMGFMGSTQVNSFTCEIVDAELVE